MLKAKILVIGPTESGKSVLSNFLADATEISGGEYHPTQGVRILEFESGALNVGNRSLSAEVELWDCSGDQKFDECWPAFMKDVSGVVIVYNPDQANHERELDTWYTHFVTQQGLKDGQCVIMGHHRPNTSEAVRVQLPTKMSKVNHVQTNLEDDADSVRADFNLFLSKVLAFISKRQDQEELSIIQ
ncbi:intraflagellar transport protein 22 homolog [Diadema antillarum]|uniref:intraflagellar transport protein 22 homolog n=1 Tax=Diadema antillarum TaxID=105358 RepID=UPI003A8B722D